MERRLEWGLEEIREEELEKLKQNRERTMRDEKLWEKRIGRDEKKTKRDYQLQWTPSERNEKKNGT